MVRMTRSKTFQAYLPSCHRTYSCIHCRAHLANHDELISKSFQGSQGRAYLFNSVVNVGCGPAEERVLLTGLHAVADIYCENCKTTLGWKYFRDGGHSCWTRAGLSTLRTVVIQDQFDQQQEQLLIQSQIRQRVRIHSKIKICFYVSRISRPYIMLPIYWIIKQ
ncbi:protein yippee-like 2 isoform X1 [Salmo salar]|uniref:Protein yippee-like 2 isoform X1 n=2 Tax=Salmo TaxID=8028 RepID=A0A1S3NR31_SALSA|nr:protein yippee-like 2 isoform X1 [Salmo salar]|eukprot:XP_014017883.1 PREDICTED: protein yippee-like 2 isoform X1 [Salmo salar]